MHINENGGCEGNHNAYVTVRSAAGVPLDGVPVSLVYEAGRIDLYTGHKPEFPGMAVFDMYGGYTVQITTDTNGSPATMDYYPFVTSHYPTNPELIAAGYCENEADCDYRASQVPAQLCFGHYSYEVVIQRGY